MKKILYLLPLALLLSQCGRKSFEQSLQEDAKDFTEKNCPRKLNDNITLDSMTFDTQTRSLTYYYTLDQAFDNPLAWNKQDVELYREDLLVQLRNDISLKKHKESGIGFRYHYYSKKNKKELFDITLTAQDYTGPMHTHTFNYREDAKLKQQTRLQFPQRQDDYTVLDSVHYDSISRTIYYDYTINGKFDVDSLYTTDTFPHEELKRQMVDNIKADPTMKIEREQEKLNFAYRYYSARTHKLLLQQEVSHKDFTQAP